MRALGASDTAPFVELSGAVAVAMADGPEAGLALVEALDGSPRGARTTSCKDLDLVAAGAVAMRPDLYYDLSPQQAQTSYGYAL